MKSLISAPRWCLVALTLCGLISWTAASPQSLFLSQGRAAAAPSSFAEGLETIVRQVDQMFERRWNEAGLKPAESAAEMQVFRRLSLALYGTIPALEELREFEADLKPDRLSRWTVMMLCDNRSAEYLAER